MKIGKREGHTHAVEIALRHNQVEGVNYLIKYIVKYQNNFVSSYFFIKYFPMLLEKGINIEPLLASKIFGVRISFNDWPENHTNLESCIRPYHGSLFQVRHMYRHVFPEPEFEPLSHDGIVDGDEVIDLRQIYKIKYSLNLLP